jgi:hypothetical protein
MSRRPALQPGEQVEVQLDSGSSVSFRRDQIRTVPAGSGFGYSARNTPASSIVETRPTPTQPVPGALAVRLPGAAEIPVKVGHKGGQSDPSRAWRPPS